VSGHILDEVAVVRDRHTRPLHGIMRLSQTACTAVVLAAMNSASAVLISMHSCVRHFHETVDCHTRALRGRSQSAGKYSAWIRLGNAITTNRMLQVIVKHV